MRNETSGNVTIEQAITSSSGQSMSSLRRKRGHQHHIRHSGTRSSNVKADEVIAALRRGDQLPVAQTVHSYSEIDQQHVNLPDDNLSVSMPNKYDSIQTSHPNETIDQNGNRNRNNDLSSDIMLIDHLNKNNRIMQTKPKNANILIDSTSEQLNRINVISRDNDDLIDSTVSSEAVGALTSDIDIEMQANSKDDLNDSISSGSSTSSKSKSKRSKKNEAMAFLNSENVVKKEKRSKKIKNLPPTEERPPLEGADAEQWTGNDGNDIENDPEAAEWSKLRCTSERAEVVAEREYRRQNRRCADYPGLAFGRSIFSSDTMMKLNIIRNELHNIMKTQLKRVCVTVPCVICRPNDSIINLILHPNVLYSYYKHILIFRANFSCKINSFSFKQNFTVICNSVSSNRKFKHLANTYLSIGPKPNFE